MMSELAQLQTAFTRALLHGETAVAAAVLGDGLVPEARLALYRHHVVSTLTEVLQAAYPVVCRLVDARFFAYAAAEYIRQQPPNGPCLFEYGATFASFLADFPPCHSLSYLPDVARLEWALHTVWEAEDAEPLALACLQQFAPEELGRLTFAFAPAVSYLESPWPIGRIWQVNQPDADPNDTVSLDAGGAHLEIQRLADEAVFHQLEPGTFAWRSALAAGQCLQEAFAAACMVAPQFCLTTALQTLFADGLIVHVSVALTEEKSS
jgi:hypothetical protein